MSRRHFLPAAVLLAASLPVLAADPNPAAPSAWASMHPAYPAASCPNPDPAAPLQLLAAIERALCQHPQTREAWANARFQAAQLGLAEAAFSPQLNASTGINHSQTRLATDTHATTSSAAATLSWLLWDAGARDADLESARQLLLAATAGRDLAAQAVFLATVEAYHQAQAAQAAVNAAAEAERAAAAALHAAEVRLQAGTATPADRLQARTALSQATLARIRAAGSARSALGALASSMGDAAQRPLQLPAASPPDPHEEEAAAALAREATDLDALIADARRQRPELRAAEARQQAAAAAVDSARAGDRPRLAVASTLGVQDVSGLTGHNAALGLTLSVPLYDGRSSDWRVRAAEAQRAARAAQTEQTRQQIALDVWNGWQRWQTAGEALKASADLVAAATAAERVASGRYAAGVGNILDVLAAQSALATARAQRVDTLREWRVARASLAHALGTLDFRLLATERAPTPGALPVPATRP